MDHADITSSTTLSRFLSRSGPPIESLVGRNIQIAPALFLDIFPLLANSLVTIHFGKWHALNPSVLNYLARNPKAMSLEHLRSLEITVGVKQALAILVFSRTVSPIVQPIRWPG